MGDIINIKLIAEALVFSTIGIIIFALVIFIYDKLTSFSIKHEIIEKQNIALAIIVGSIIVGISLIIAFAHG